jgi:hypothetical protein
MRVVFTQSPIDLTHLERFVIAETAKFMKGTAVSIRKLYKMLDKYISDSKSKEAEKKRMAGDRCFNSLEWRNRPTVNPEGVRTALKRVDATIEGIYNMTATLGRKISKEAVGGEIERVNIKLDVSNPSLDKVYQVLNEHVEEGLNRFKQQQTEETNPRISRIHRIRELLRFNH